MYTLKKHEINFSGETILKLPVRAEVLDAGITGPGNCACIWVLQDAEPTVLENRRFIAVAENFKIDYVAPKYIGSFATDPSNTLIFHVFEVSRDPGELRDYSVSR